MPEVIKILKTRPALPKACSRSLKCECGREAVVTWLVGNGNRASTDFPLCLSSYTFKCDSNTVKVGH